MGVTTIVGSSCDIPTGSQVIYSSTITSPITQTLSLENFFRIFFKESDLILCLLIYFFGISIVLIFFLSISFLIISKDENIFSPELKNNFPPYFSTIFFSTLNFFSCSFPLTIISGLILFIIFETDSLIKITSSTQMLLLRPSALKVSET